MPHLNPVCAPRTASASAERDAGHNRRPTGTACVGGTLHFAVRDRAFDFDAAPAATIAKSTDHGRTRTWTGRRPGRRCR
ncbi:hypothetical protein [Streptomyces peucetius]|uniref:Uncharacterized protein n=1 Tax=Streptomyces peucetius TaxID=1950 RepID=A0ABY6IDE5_STRPE|nr:hypothetical protein [Streptomyces peucetius]UYQ65038.1 hypothetical protein OGH68_28645 [Streptomyces peucetius]